MWDAVREAVEGVEETSEYEKAAKTFALKMLERCERAIDRFELACCLKLLLEVGIQLAYMRRFKPEARLEVLRRRSRRAVAFNMSMLERSGLPGPYKKRILRTYLKVSSYVHPSLEALQGEIPDELVAKAVEILVMIYRASRQQKL